MSQDAHGFADETELGVEAFAEAAAAWRLGLERAGGAPLRHLSVEYFALHLQPLGGPGFVLHMGGAVRAAVHGDLGAAALTSRWPVCASLHLALPISRATATITGLSRLFDQMIPNK